MRRKLAVLLSVVLVLAMLITSSPISVSAAGITKKLGANGKAAMKLYNISENCIIVASAKSCGDDISYLARQAGLKASSGKMYMVYVPEGTHKISGYIGVPANVVLVGEKKTQYVPTAKDRKMALVSGSVYGGTWNAQNKVDSIIWFNYVKFSGKNGEIRNTFLRNSLVDAIHYGSGSSKAKLGGAKAIGNNIYNIKTNGITAMNNGSFKEISGNTIKKIGTGTTGSGISITHANVDTIKNNKIINTKGHGISTDTEQTGPNIVQKSVSIKLIEGNKITNPGGHGIYIEQKVTVKKIKNNVIKKSKNCGLCMDYNAKVKMFEGNTIKNCQQSNITLKGKGSYLVIGSKNKSQGSKTMGLMVNDEAKVVIKGTGNVFSNNENDIRVHSSMGAKLVIKNKKKNNLGNVYYY